MATKAAVKVSGKKPAAKKPTTPKAPKAEKTTTSDAATSTVKPEGFKYPVLDASTLPTPRKRTSTGGQSPYPFAALEVGQGTQVVSELDADLYTNDDEFVQALTEDLRTIANRLSGAVRRFNKANPGKAFKVYTADTSVVVTRTA